MTAFQPGRQLITHNLFDAQVKIALCQFKVTPDKQENLKTAQKAIEVELSSNICVNLQDLRSSDHYCIFAGEDSLLALDEYIFKFFCIQAHFLSKNVSRWL